MGRKKCGLYALSSGANQTKEIKFKNFAFTEMIMGFYERLDELKEQDPETWKQWDDKRLQDLRRNHFDSTRILMEVLVRAIKKRGWTWDISRGKSNDWAARIERKEGSYDGRDSSSRADTLLDAYLNAFKQSIVQE